MTSETENKIIFTTVLTGIIAIIATLFFHQPTTPIGDCGTDVALNNGLRIFFIVAINVIVVVVVAFLSCILGIAINGIINNSMRLYRSWKRSREVKEKPANRFTFKKIDWKQVTYNLINAMRSFEVAWCVFTGAFLCIGAFFAGINHPKMCFKNPGAVADFYLISGIALIFISTIASLVFTLAFEKVEFRLKKFLKLI